jgi:hypothetical protein
MANRGFRRYDIAGWNRYREDVRREQREQRQQQREKRKNRTDRADPNAREHA